MIPRLASSIAAAIAAALVAGALAVATPPAQASDTLTTLQADAAATPGEPKVLTTETGVGLVLWVAPHNDAGGNSVRTPELRRNTGAGWLPVSLPLAVPGYTLDNFAGAANINLAQDPTTHRVVIIGQAFDNAFANQTLGTYLWRSSDDGATWTGPIKVYDGFGYSAEVGFDGTGGFYMTVIEVAAPLSHARQVHVPASYATQDFADTYPLTPRSGNAPATQLASVGSSYTPAYAFAAPGEPDWPVYLHLGTADDGAQDKQAFPCSNGLALAAAGGLWSVMGAQTLGAVATNRAPDCGTGARRLVVRGFDDLGNISAEVPVSTGSTSSYDLAPFPNPDQTNNIAAGWSEGSTVSYATVVPAVGVSGVVDRRVVVDQQSGFDFFGNISVSRDWIAGTGYRPSDGKTVLWVADTSAVPAPQPPAPVPATVEVPKKQQSYSRGKGKLKYAVAVSDAGDVTVTAQVKAGKRTGTKSKAFHASKAGSYQGNLKLPKKLKRLARARKAKVTLTITIVTAAGATTVKTIKVRIKK